MDALREHFKNSKFPGDAEEYMPVVFLPPRDGRTLTDPVPIIGPLSPPSSVENQSEPPSDGVNGHIDNAIYYDEVEVEEEGGDDGLSGCCSYADDDM